MGRFAGLGGSIGEGDGAKDSDGEKDGGSVGDDIDDGGYDIDANGAPKGEDGNGDGDDSSTTCSRPR